MTIKDWKEFKIKYGDEKEFNEIAIRRLDWDRPENVVEIVE